MKRDRHRAEKLIDIGSTTALSALVEIVSTSTAGVLTRQAQAMLDRLPPEDQDYAIAGFCDELQSFVESVPGARRATPPTPERSRRGRTA
jgi:hypothetical protein